MPTPPARRQTSLGKLSPPRLGRVFDRERLFGLMDAIAMAPGLWIAGPPGMGKTTLVATYLQRTAAPCLWLQLDASDADAASFAHYLAEAALPLVGRRKIQFAQPSADDLRDVPTFIRRCLRQLSLCLNGPWTLVLDNVQEIGSAPLLHHGLAASLAELPAGARVIAISREPPPEAYARALGGQQLALIESGDLQFNDDEAEHLVALHGHTWEGPALREATDGWAAAMILMLATRSTLDAHAARQDGASRERLFALFAGEVLQKMSAKDSQTLMRIAFLPSASAAMAIAISGDAWAADLLADLARRSLFTERRKGVASPHVITYTFHALFGEFLRARAARELDANALRALQTQAAAILAAEGQADAAIAQLIAAQAWPEALDLLMAHAGRFLAQGRTATVRDWILALPDSHRHSAQALYWLGCCELAVNPASALLHLQAALTGFDAADDAYGAFCAACAAADAIVFLGDSLNTLQKWLPMMLAYAPTYLALRDAQTDMAETDLRVLPGLLATFAYLETAHPLTATLADLAEHMLDQPLAASQRILLGSLAYYFLWTGQRVRLDRILVKIDRMSAAPDVAGATLLRWYGITAVILSLIGRIDESMACAQRALALVRADTGLGGMTARAHLLVVLAALAARDVELARTHLHATALVLDAGNAIDTTTYEFQRGLLMLLDGQWSDAAMLMRASVASSQKSGWPMRQHIALLGQTLTAVEASAMDEAQVSLQAVLDHRFYAVCRWHQWIGALIEAHLAERLGDRARCLTALAAAFSTGREFGYDFGPMPYCCGDMMPRLASIALAHDIDRPFALQIIQRYKLPAPVDAAAQWPWPIRIRTLGQFAVERDGEADKPARKESRKPLDLLKLLLASGGKAVAVKHLCAELWPDAEGDAARNSFDNALHRLRKLMGGDRHVQLQAGGLTLDAASCWTDVAALSTCLAQMETCLGKPASDAGAAELLMLVDRALTLYQGDFLAGEDSLPNVQQARERIRARWTRQLGEAGAHLQASGQPAQAAQIYQRVVEQQPLAEDIYRRLIQCLIAQGRPAEAYEAYRRCRQQLSVVLGLKPAPETDALVAGLRNL
jgi:LuxR family transcriptional regulator, maltose regulon positive regulatory protein